MLTQEERIELITHAIYELADKLGDSIHDPLSPSILSLRLGISLDTQGAFMISFRALSLLRDFSGMSAPEILDVFREEMAEIEPKAAEFDDTTIYAYIQAFAKTFLVEELQPLSIKLKESLFKQKK